ncbi:DNA-3-methyladenine glycosylase [Bdellovibrio sp. qaytius]|nr:DNA-3-methyladenine glycosylase [Bdellovibrio sp. qaytius]
MKSTKLKKSFYQRDTTLVARELLGKRLVHVVNGERLSGIITETEAYLGVIDRGAHTFGNKRTKRTETMYLPGGHSYVYLIYGMYDCLNVVTQKKDIPEAVLIRALQPDEGLKTMAKARKQKSFDPKNKKHLWSLTTGPGKLAQALKINRHHNELLFTDEELFIEDIKMKINSSDIIASPRVGIDYAQEAKHWELRFTIRDNFFISRKP